MSIILYQIINLILLYEVLFYMKTFKVGSFFAGVGGICLGFLNAKAKINANLKLINS